MTQEPDYLYKVVGSIFIKHPTGESQVENSIDLFTLPSDGIKVNFVLPFGITSK